VLGHQAGAVDDVLEVALGETLALGDHAETVGPRGLGGLGVLEDLLRGHHRVHRRVGLREARLGAETTILRAAARLRVHERAHVGGVAEALQAHLPGTVHQRLDLGAVDYLPEPERLFWRDERRHRAPP
jgi:hypothetical protein